MRTKEELEQIKEKYEELNQVTGGIQDSPSGFMDEQTTEEIPGEY